MYIGCPDQDAELIRRASIYAALPPSDQIRLLHLAISNDLRGGEASNGRAAALIAPTGAESLESWVEQLLPRLGLDPSSMVRHELASIAVPHEWWCEFEEVAGKPDVPASDPWLRSVAVSASLALSGCVPLVCFAFGTWHLPLHSDRNSWHDLVELATCYLYRTVATGRFNGSHFGSLVGSGAYSQVRQKDGLVVKNAKNLAAEAFMLEQEALLHQQLIEGTAAKHIPGFAGYDSDQRLLYRDYVPGPTGHEILLRGGALPGLERDALQVAYADLRDSAGSLGQFLDLHPGNFIWCQAESRWIFIDLGPVPRIGADYYDLSSFDAYFRDVWARRLERMASEPIRSVDWC